MLDESFNAKSDLLLAKAFIKKKQLSKSADYFERALQQSQAGSSFMYQNKSSAYLSRADFYVEKGMLSKALLDCQNAIIALQPNFNNKNTLTNPTADALQMSDLLLQSLRKKSKLLRKKYKENADPRYLHAALETGKLGLKLIDQATSELTINENDVIGIINKNYGFYEEVLMAYYELNQIDHSTICLLYTSPSPRDRQKSRMPSSA